MALAHLIGKDGFQRYTEFYLEVGKDPESYLIMDNGVIEGDPRPIEELVEKAIQVNADELILPDVFMERHATLAKTYDALSKIKAHAYMNSKIARLKTMAVPQGKTLEEWFESARDLAALPIDAIGIPKVLAKLPSKNSPEGYWLNRLEALRMIQPLLQGTQTEVHLLGCWDTPLEIKAISNAIANDTCPKVRGTDSAIPYAYARKGMKMSEGPRPEGAIDFEADDLDPDDLTLRYNIMMWQVECADIDLDAKDNHIPRFW
ncbi:hypothetical protein D3C74_226750 [compost metagenome]